MRVMQGAGDERISVHMLDSTIDIWSQELGPNLGCLASLVDPCRPRGYVAYRGNRFGLRPRER